MILTSTKCPRRCDNWVKWKQARWKWCNPEDWVDDASDDGEARVECANKMGLYDVCTIRIFSQTGFTRFYHILPYCTMFCLLGFFLPSNQGWYWLLSLNHSCADARQWHHGPTPFRCRWRCRVCFLGWQVLGDDFISVPSGTSNASKRFCGVFFMPVSAHFMTFIPQQLIRIVYFIIYIYIYNYYNLYLYVLHPKRLLGFRLGGHFASGGGGGGGGGSGSKRTCSITCIYAAPLVPEDSGPGWLGGA